MTPFPRIIAAAFVFLSLSAGLHAGQRELSVIGSSTEAVRGLAAIPLKGIPQALVHDAAGVAIFPHVIRVGFFAGGRYGRGVILVHEPGGAWSNPVFVSLAGGGFGGQAGVEAAESVLVFKTRASLDRALEGWLTLGGDVAVAAGPVGREAAAATDVGLKAEVYSYSRSRGLFAGVSLEGAAIHVDTAANEAFYGFRGGQAAGVLAIRNECHPAATTLKAQLSLLGGPPRP